MVGDEGHITCTHVDCPNRAAADELLRGMLASQRDGLMESGRKLASEREDLIAQGVDPAELEIPLAPADPDVSLASVDGEDELREQFRGLIDEEALIGEPVRLSDLMATVLPLLAERDAAVERAEHKSALAAKQLLRSARLRADLAAAREQLDQVRADIDDWAEGIALTHDELVRLEAILDAAPADETGGAFGE
jgi:hypothetical protein